MTSQVVVVPLTDPGAERGPGALADLGGRPLLAWTLEAAAESTATARVAVVGAQGDALAWARGWGAEAVALRAAPLTAEEAALHALAALAACGPLPEHVALLSPRLPLRRPGRLDEARAVLAHAGADSLMSVCAEPPCFWCRSPGGLIPLYDHQGHGAPSHREPWLRETGSLYLLGRAGLERHRLRLFGRIATLETAWAETVRADDPAGLAACRALLAQVRPGAGVAAATAG